MYIIQIKLIRFQISILLSLLYIILLNTNKIQNNITSYGKLINNNLVGGNIEEEEEEGEEDLLSSEEESLLDTNQENILSELKQEEKEEEDIDRKIDNIIQEEIVLNKSDYNNRMKNSRKLGATQYKLNTKSLTKVPKNKLNKQSEEYKTAEEEYNKIIKDVGKYDTNKDGVIDYNDIEPEEDLIQEEMENIEEEMEKHMNKLKK